MRWKRKIQTLYANPPGIGNTATIGTLPPHSWPASNPMLPTAIIIVSILLGMSLVCFFLAYLFHKYL